MFCYGYAESLALLSVGHRLFEGSPSYTHTASSHINSTQLQASHHLFESAALFLADQVTSGYVEVLKI